MVALRAFPVSGLGCGFRDPQCGALLNPGVNLMFQPRDARRTKVYRRREIARLDLLSEMVARVIHALPRLQLFVTQQLHLASPMLETAWNMLERRTPFQEIS